MSTDAWYALAGSENDVAVSTRIRFSRNLANFVFPERLKHEDAERVRILIFDAFNHVENPEHFQTVQLKELDKLGQVILTERGVFTPDMFENQKAAGVIRSDGKISCSVNVRDHLRLSVFEAGLAVQNCFDNGTDLDSQLQNSLQFAASAETGYLTESLHDAGSGIKCSVVLHLPAIAYSGAPEKQFAFLKNTSCRIQGCFSSAGEKPPLGAFYVLWNHALGYRSETEQLHEIKETAQKIIINERGLCADFAANRITILRDYLYRAVAVIKYSRLIECGEGIDLLSKIKWGLNCGVLEGIEHNLLSALLYRIQAGHMNYVLRGGNFNFEKDIISDEAKIARLRALIIQDALDNTKILM